jgi:hypothetical protein
MDGEPIRADGVYKLTHVKQWGLGTAGLRQARRNGLKIRRLGRISVVLGKDFLEFAETLPVVPGATK